MPVRRKGIKAEDLNRALYKIKGGQMRAVLTRNLAEEAKKQVMDEFRHGRDPYGEKWLPVLRGGRPLLFHGHMRSSFHGEPTSRGFRLVSNLIYTAVHNYGATIRAKSGPYLVFKIGRGRKAKWAKVEEVKIPKRQLVPDGRLGPIWTRAFHRVTKRVIAAFFPSNAKMRRLMYGG